MPAPYKHPQTPANLEHELLLECRDALRKVVTDPTSSPNSVAKASSELRHVLEQLRSIEKQTPADPELDPIAAIKLQLATGAKTPRKRATK